MDSHKAVPTRSHLAARVGRFGPVAMIRLVLWSGVRYVCADDGVTIA